MQKLPFIFLAILIALTICSCNTTEPPADNTSPGRRDYEWTLDTLHTDELLYISRIWGCSPNDIWAVGPRSWTATSIWHYDGNSWKCDSSFGVNSPFAIYGHHADEIWLGNTDGIIWRYGGYNWNKYGQYKAEGFSNTIIQNMFGNSTDNIYAVGYVQNNTDYKGMIIHYNGSRWDFVDIPPVKCAFRDIRIDKTGTLIIDGYTEEGGGKVFTWNGKKLEEVLSSSLSTNVSNVGETVLVTDGSKIYKYENGSLDLILDKTGTALLGKIWGGRSPKDFFWNSAFEGLIHFNGTDFQVLYETEFYIGGASIFDKDVFFILTDNQQKMNNFILHGKLKE